VAAQTWGTADQVGATFDWTLVKPFTLPSSAVVTDAYGQARLYSFTTETLPNYNNVRPQILTVDEQVPVWQAAGFAKLPVALTLLQTATSPVARKRKFAYDGSGLLLSATPDGGGEGATTTYGYAKS